MKQTKFLLLALFFTQPVTALSLKFWTWFSSVNPAEKAERMAHLHRIYAIKDEFENIEKTYKTSSAPVHIEKFKDENFIKSLENDTEQFKDTFFAAQRNWQLSTTLYYASSIHISKAKVLLPAIEKAEKEAGVSKKDRPVSWYETLQKKAAKNYYPLEADKRKTEFKEWQKNYAKDNQAAKDRNDFFEQWRAKNPNYNKPDFNKI